MKKTRTRLWSLLLTVAMVLTLLPATALADGVECTDENCTHVAAIENKHYTTLREAFNSATENQVIQLLDNVDLSTYITVSKPITLDLNGHDITSTGLAFFINQDIEFIIRDETNQGSISSNNTNNLIEVKAGELIVEGGQLSNNWYVIYAYQSGKATIKGGTLKSKVASVLSTNGSQEGDPDYSGDAVMNVEGGTLLSEKDVTIYVPAGTLNVSGGKIEGVTAIYSKCGTTTITGGSIKSEGDKTEFKHSDNGCIATGDAMVIEACNYPNGNPAVYISGGNFSSKNGSAVGYYQYENNQAEEVSITGGTFSSDVSKYIAPGYVCNPFEESYIVEPLGQDNAAAMVDGDSGVTYFETLKDAIAAAKDGDTVTLLKDASGDGVVVPSGSNIVIDFAGYTYDIDGTTVGSTGTETNGFQLLKNSTIEFRNGTLTSSKAKILIQNYSNLTLKDMTLDGTGLLGANPYVVSNNFGEVMITGNTSITAAPDGFAFDVYYWPGGGYSEGVSVTLDTTGTIIGNIEYASDKQGTADAYNKASLTIINGKIDGEISTKLEKTSISISGGTFSTSVAQYVTEDLKYELNNGNAFTYYPTLSAALANAESGAVINDLTEEGSEDPISVAIVTFDPGNGDKDWSVTLISGNTVARPDAPSRAGYRFTGWYVDGYEYDFDTPVTRDITITAGWKKIGSTGSTEPTYVAALEKMTNGSAVVSPKQAQEGDEVTITVTPDAGYVVDEVIVTDAHGDDVRVYEEGNNVYTFTMPDSRVTIEVTFKAKETAPAVPTAPAGWVNPFADVAANAWYYDAVGYANVNGLMGGTSATTFAPNGAMNRSMVWTVIARLAGQTISGANWAEDAKAWAVAQGVSDGTNPDGNVTREELVTMLYRYIGSPVMNVPELGLINSYPDAASVSDWAQDAFAWALSRGIIDGRDGKLASGESVTRAEAATILARFHLLTK